MVLGGDNLFRISISFAMEFAITNTIKAPVRIHDCKNVKTSFVDGQRS